MLSLVNNTSDYLITARILYFILYKQEILVEKKKLLCSVIAVTSITKILIVRDIYIYIYLIIQKKQLIMTRFFIRAIHLKSS